MQTRIALLASTAVAALALATPADAAGNWYASVTGGGNWADDNSFFVNPAGVTRLTWNTDDDTGFVVAGAIGMGLGNVMSGLRVELEAGWRQNQIDGSFTSNFSGPPPTASGMVDYDHETFSVLANVWFDIPIGSGFTPYVGGGIGWADTSFDGAYTCAANCTSGSFDFSDYGFAWQAGGGINFNVSPNMKLGVGYRFFQGPEPTALPPTPLANISSKELENDNHSAVVTLIFGM